MNAQHKKLLAAKALAGPLPGDSLISLRQPYASLVVAEWKSIENRTWRVNHTGLLWIHASATRSDESALLADYADRVGAPAGRLPDASKLVYGAIIGVAWLDGCYALDSADCPCWLYQMASAEGPYCWYLSAAQALKKPIPYRAAVGLCKYGKENCR